LSPSRDRVSVRAEPIGDERLWLLRAVTVLVAPREVFAGLRDDSDAAARARSEAVLALVLLSGIGTVLWTPVAGTLLNDVQLDWLDAAVWAFLGGGIYAVAVYFAGGLVLHWATRIVGGTTYRQARHLLAFASGPLALSLLVVWPVRLAVYGEDVFRSGGSDHGAGNTIFVAVELALAAWAVGLLVLGVRELYRR
jgi:Yip1-like protein